MKALKNITLFLFTFCIVWNVTFAQSNKVTLVETGQELFFRNTSEGAASYLWDFGDGTTSTEFHGRHVFQREGEYEVRLVIANGTCSKVITQKVTATDFAQPGSLFENLRIYPNPVVDFTTLELPLAFKGDLKLKVMDGQGKLVKAWTEHVNQGKSSLSLDLQSLAQGMYFLNVRSGQEEASLKVVKQ